MKRNFLITLILLGSISLLHAENTPIEKIDNRINLYQKYLERIPLEVQDIKEKDFKLKRKREEIELIINKYLEVLDNCSNSKLKPLTQQICEELVQSNYGHMLTEEKEKLQEAIEYIEREKEKIQIEIQEIHKIKEYIKVLKNIRELLLQSN